MKKNIIFSLLIIVIIGIFFRFYDLGRVPDSLNWDEVSWGYNAYSIGMTGKDEYGVSMPLSFKAFGDFKQPMYIYLDALPMLVFGLTGFAVRFPSAIFGSLTIISVFLLTRELFYKDKKRDILSLLVSLLFALSPWSIQFSRVAFEANVGLFFTITGVAIFLRGIRTKTFWQIILGSAVMSLSCYTYHSQKIFTPLLFASLIVISNKFWLKEKKLLIILLATFLVFNSIWLLDSRTTARGRSVLFTSNQTQLLADSTQKLIDDNAHHDLIGKVIHNRRLVYLNVYVANYLSHFNPQYLFLKGDNPRHHPPEMGNLYFVSFPFIILGMVYLWRKQKSAAYVMFTWLLLAPAASSLAVDAPNASRSMVFLPTWDIFTAFGIFTLLEISRKYIMPFLMITGVSVVFLVNSIVYTHTYFSHTDKENAFYWQYGYREAVLFVKEYQASHHVKAFFASSFEQPYIFYLFYAKVNPAEYSMSGGSQRLQEKCSVIENTYFGKCEDKIQPGDIFFSFDEKKDQHLVKVKEINYPNHEVAIRVYRYQ